MLAVLKKLKKAPQNLLAVARLLPLQVATAHRDRTGLFLIINWSSTKVSLFVTITHRLRRLFEIVIAKVQNRCVHDYSLGLHLQLTYLADI